MQHSQFLGLRTNLQPDPEECKPLLYDRIHNIPVLQDTSESLFLLRRTSPNVQFYRIFWEAKKKRFWGKKIVWELMYDLRLGDTEVK